MTEKLSVEIRKENGKHAARRLRRSGNIPAVLYGHKEETVPLTIKGEDLSRVMRHGARFVELIGAVSDTALIREMQWDTYGVELLHVDFARVSADERVRREVAIELRGEAPGVRAGGVVQLILHSVDIECPAMAIPDKLQLNINHLELEGVLRVSDLSPPENVTILTDKESVVVQCVVPLEMPEEAAPAAEAIEPELIGRKAEPEEGEEGVEEK
ncbi:MAG: 50S ribosomal protein L25 [Planctomycetia bacterium]|nr:50S ribosomal protein L25 [Planctomycetia bacterium]